MFRFMFNIFPENKKNLVALRDVNHAKHIRYNQILQTSLF